MLGAARLIRMRRLFLVSQFRLSQIGVSGARYKTLLVEMREKLNGGFH